MFSAVDIFNKNVMMNQWTSVLKYIPFYMEGVGWIVPAIIGACIGVIVSIVINKNNSKRCFPISENTFLLEK